MISVQAVLGTVYS